MHASDLTKQGNHIITPSSKAAPKEIVVCIIVSADEEAISSRALAAVLNWNGTQSMLAKMDVPNSSGYSNMCHSRDLALASPAGSLVHYNQSSCG